MRERHIINYINFFCAILQEPSNPLYILIYELKNKACDYFKHLRYFKLKFPKTLQIFYTHFGVEEVCVYEILLFRIQTLNNLEVRIDS